MATKNHEITRSHRILRTHCHATEIHAEEAEEEVLHTHSGRDFAKDYSKNLTKQTSRPNDSAVTILPQDERFRYDIIDHLSWVPAKVSRLDLIKIVKGVLTPLLEVLSEQRRWELGPMGVNYLATRLK